MIQSDFTTYWQRNFKVTIAAGIVLAVTAASFPHPSAGAVSLGVLLGACVSAFRIRMGARAIERLFRGAAPKYMMSQHLLRYGVFVAALLLGFSSNMINGWATLAGLVLGNIITVSLAVGEGLT